MERVLHRARELSADRERDRDYLALCAGLGVAPGPAPRPAPVGSLPIGDDFEVELPGDDPAVLLVTRVGNASVVAVLPVDRRAGCPECVVAKVAEVGHFHPGLAAPTWHRDRALELVLTMWKRHGEAIAISDAFGPQSWSTVLPAPSCPTCGRRERAFAPGRTRPGSADPDATRRSTSETAGPRSRSADSFVRGTRRFVGFASAMGNPSPVGSDDDAVALVDAPVLLGGGAHAHEVAGGKGWSTDQALASCIGEGLERYFLSGVFRDLTRPVSMSHLAGIGLRHVSPETFGLPFVEPTGRYATPDANTVLDWTRSFDLIADRVTWIPTNLVECPYVPSARAAAISVASTNGAATGATVADATIHGMLELLERDAFWYYSRTGRVPRLLEPPASPGGALDLTAMLLENPFEVPVVQVVGVPRDDPGPLARGTGAGLTVAEATARAHAECLQMHASLATALDVEPTEEHMRSLWFSGAAREIWPGFFDPEPRDEPARVREFADAGELQRHVLDQSREEGMRWFRTTLIEHPAFAVVKVTCSHINVTDASFFAGNDRLERFAAALGDPPPEIAYRGPLFM